jgi:hypothetical protein
MAKKKKCRCKKDQDGECPSCRAEIEVCVGKLGTVMLEFLREMEALPIKMKERIRQVEEEHAAVCAGCKQKYLDLGASRHIRALKDVSEDTATTVYQAMVRQLEAKGSPGPLTQKAWRDICVSNGWKGPGKGEE